MASHPRDCDAVIAIGSVIRGETAHFDYVCQAASSGVLRAGMDADKPAVFCVLTDDHIDQSRARSGGKHGNKGVKPQWRPYKWPACAGTFNADRIGASDCEPSLHGHPLFAPLVVGLLLRGIAATFSTGYLMHDDHFLVVEVGASWAAGEDYNDWLPWNQGDTRRRTATLPIRAPSSCCSWSCPTWESATHRIKCGCCACCTACIPD